MMKEFLLDHLNKYPEMQFQDAVKLLFQIEFGPGHLIENMNAAEKLLLNEIELTKDDVAEIVPVSESLVRLHLGGFHQKDVPALLNAMIETAENIEPDLNRFYDSLNALKEMNVFDRHELDVFLEDYLKRSSLMISHSEHYRRTYQPHYRILMKELAENLLYNR